jgi:hypothetical protein
MRSERTDSPQFQKCWFTGETYQTSAGHSTPHFIPMSEQASNSNFDFPGNHPWSTPHKPNAR